MVFERLVFEVYAAYSYGEKNIYIRRAIDESKEYGEKIKYEAAQEYPSLLPLDQAIRGDQRIREAIWNHFEIDKDTPYPSLPKYILDGTLSFVVYEFEYGKVSILDDAPTDFVKFFKALAKCQKLDFQLISAASAVAGEYLDKHPLTFSINRIKD